MRPLNRVRDGFVLRFEFFKLVISPRVVGEDELMAPDRSAPIPFTPLPRDFTGLTMPASVPDGMHLELSRAKLVSGKEAEFEQWMTMLNSRPDELQEGLPAERVIFEATFRNVEADESVWMYHITLRGKETGGLDETIPVDAEHAAYSRSVKEPGWEELEPKFMLTPNHLVYEMQRWAATGKP